jgi:hypothetical protein
MQACIAHAGVLARLRELRLRPVPRGDAGAGKPNLTDGVARQPPARRRINDGHLGAGIRARGAAARQQAQHIRGRRAGRRRRCDTPGRGLQRRAVELKHAAAAVTHVNGVLRQPVAGTQRVRG